MGQPSTQPRFSLGAIVGEPWSPDFEMAYFRGMPLAELRERHKTHMEIFGVEAAIREHYPNPVETVMEVGCGPIGGLLSAYKGGKNRFSVEPLAVNYARELSASDYASLEGITLLPCFSYNIPLQDRYVDIAFCLECLDHCPDMDLFFKSQSELARVLKPGGLLFFMLPARDDRECGHDGHPCNPSGKEIVASFQQLWMQVVKHNFGREGTWLILKKS